MHFSSPGPSFVSPGPKFIPPHTQLDPHSDDNIYEGGPATTTGAVVKDAADKKKTGQKKNLDKGKEKSVGRVHGGDTYRLEGPAGKQ
jgi:hypothetical protein